MASIGAIFTSIYVTHKAVKSMAKLIRQSCDESQPAICLSGGDRAIRRPPEHSWMPDKPQKQAAQKQPGQLSALIPGWIVNVYNHHLMVKSVSCCVRGSWLFSDLVTYMAFTLVTSIKELHTHIQGDNNKPY